MAEHDYTPTGRIENMLKDLEAVQAISLSLCLPLPLTWQVFQLRLSFVAAGFGAEDSAAMMNQFSGYPAETARSNSTSPLAHCRPDRPAAARELNLISKFALSEGRVHEGQSEAFRAAALNDALPMRKAFPVTLAVRVCFSIERDDGAADVRMILAVTYTDRTAIDTALARSAHAYAKVATKAVLVRFFTRRYLPSHKRGSRPCPVAPAPYAG